MPSPEPPPSAASRPAAIEITAPGRLHLGFLDLHGGLGRRFASLGVTLDGIATRIRLEPAAAMRVTGAEADRAARLLDRLEAAWGTGPVRATVLDAMPAHAGLGSGTQLGLALGVALARLAGRAEDARAVATLLDRGGRSGIGIGAFESGGVLLDGGRGTEDQPPPLLARLPFPESWRILLIHDPSCQGMHGPGEGRAFGNLPPFPAELAAELCRLVVMQFLPGVALADLGQAGPAVTRIQALVGDYFAPFQGGRFTSPRVAAALARLAALGVTGYGQSSWGPTGFAFVATGEAERLLAEMRGRLVAEGLGISLHRGRNQGAAIRPLPAVRAGVSPWA